MNEKCIKTRKTMSKLKSCFRLEDTDGKKEEGSYILFVA